MKERVLKVKKNNEPEISEIIKSLYRHISKRRKKQLLVLVFVMIISSFAEVFSIGAVIPFIGLITNPASFSNNEYILIVSDFFEIKNNDQLLFLITSIFIGLTIISATIRAFSVWLQTRLTHLIGADLAAKSFSNTLRRSYEFHVINNSAKLISTIFAKISTMLNRVITPCLGIIHSFFMTLTIVTGLFLLSPFVGITIFVSLAIAYLLITYLIRRVVLMNGKIVADELNNVMKKLQEGLGGIRDIIIDNTQDLFIKNFVNSDYPQRVASSKLEFISLSPRMLVEMIGLIIFAIVTFLLAKGDPTANFVPLLAAIALGAVRLLPFLQGAYSGWSYINAHRFIVSDVLEVLEEPSLEHISSPKAINSFNREIRVEDMSFSYLKASGRVLNNVSFAIKKKSKVGIVGQTGGGKSTLMDLMMGLLRASEGNIYVDDEKLSEKNILSWQSKISHVPQSIYLLDGSVYENIAFGLEKKQINIERAIECAKVALIHETVSAFENGYDTKIGERGSKLSGGQRQRIGIARALYKNSEIIFFDEATNALDSDTENKIMESIYKFSKDITIFIVAHRLDTLKECDLIIEVKNNNVILHSDLNTYLQKNKI